jgi:hypothetical protein
MSQRCESCRQKHKRCGHGDLPKHLIIPDTQVKPGVPLDHLTWIGQYIADKRPDVVIQIGDFADMPSLSSYDKGKKTFEGRRYKADIETTKAAMDQLMRPFAAMPDYKPRLILTLGNHEDRISRAIQDDAKLDGTIGLSDLGYEEMGWEVYPFLRVVKVDGVAYSHYFTSGTYGRSVSSASALMKQVNGSAVMGHIQYSDIHFHPKTQHFTLLVGTCYLHDEDYLGEQGNNNRRQVVMLHEVNDGRADPMFVSLDYLKRKYAA